MKKSFVFIVLFTSISLSVEAQKYFTREGKISFYSDAPMEKIEAHNGKATSVIDLETGKMEFEVLIKAFQFEKALMQEHFNENYMESNQFPKSKFKGFIYDIANLDLSKDGVYPVDVRGNLTIHGETQKVTSQGTISIVDGQVSSEAKFEIAVSDYKIEIPSIVREKIAKVVTIDVKINNYQELPQNKK